MLVEPGQVLIGRSTGLSGGQDGVRDSSTGARSGRVPDRGCGRGGALLRPRIAPTPLATTVPCLTSGEMAPATPAGAASRPAHVVIVMLENKDEGDVLRDGPYFASLAASGAC